MNEDSFNVIPAIDILNGKCVRLTQGKYNKVEEFSVNPKEIAQKWIDQGAKRLHIVDLDGAKEGNPVNFKVIADMAKNNGITVEVGGGIRSIETIKNYLNEGINYIILGTKAFKDKDFLNDALNTFDERIILGLDLKDGKLALSGWLETKDISMDNLAKLTNKVKQIIYTDTTKDGTLTGPNLKSIEEIASSIKSKIIVSGGISKLDDISAILKMQKQKYSNISGVILGKSLYKETIDLASAIELVREQKG